MRSSLRAEGKLGPFPESIAGAVAYLSFIPAIVFLVRQPYRTNLFVRFHSVQCILLWIAGIVAAIAFRFLGLLLLHIPLVGPLLLVVIGTVSVLAALLLWLVLVVKAAQGEMFGVPWIGDLAERFAGALKG